MKNLTNIFISVFYTGYFKIWPGTFETLISILILFPIIKLNVVSFTIFVSIFFLVSILSIYFIKKYSFDTNSHDSGVIVIEEFLGIFLILIFYEYIFFYSDLITLLLIFILFRFFDITKIYPANIIDKKMKNSLGVLLDDFVASIYTITIMYMINVIIY